MLNETMIRRHLLTKGYDNDRIDVMEIPTSSQREPLWKVVVTDDRGMDWLQEQGDSATIVSWLNQVPQNR